MNEAGKKNKQHRQKNRGQARAAQGLKERASIGAASAGSSNGTQGNGRSSQTARGQKRSSSPVKRASSSADLSGLPVQKNDEVNVEMIGLTHEGEGVGRVEGYTLFIRGALPGEVVRAKVLKVKKQYGYAKLLEIVSPSPDRIAPPCEIYTQCGGCQLQHMSYEAQLQWKRQHVIDNLERIGKLQVAGSRVQIGGDESRAVGQGFLQGVGDAHGDKDKDKDEDKEQRPASSKLTQVSIEESNTSEEKMMHVSVEEFKASEDKMMHVSTEKSKDSEEKMMRVSTEESKTSEEKMVRVSTEEFKASEEKVMHVSIEKTKASENNIDAASAGVIVHPTLGMSDPWRYRNKAQVPMGMAEEGGLIGGFYAQSSHRIIDMEACLIQHEQNDEIVRRVKKIGRELGISAYNEETGEGLLRHVVVRVGFRTGELMVVLVTNGSKIPQADAWVTAIRAQVSGVESICQNINTKRTNVIFGDVTKTLWGRDVIYDYIGNVKFAISARSFYQVNPVQTEVLYGKTLEYASLTGLETVIDAYCGIGTISLFLAQHAERVYGVEIVPEAIEDARANAALNGIANAEFAVGAAEAVIPAWQAQGITADVVVVDPPRKGCDAVLLETLLTMRPERIVYVSCNPATLARDLRALSDGGYRVAEVQPVDMFPHTVHVECCVSLVRKH